MIEKKKKIRSRPSEDFFVTRISGDKDISFFWPQGHEFPSNEWRVQ